jgi:hypothetical protein
MLPFVKETWFLWWMLVILLIVRWFHVVSAPADQVWEAEEAEVASGWRQGYSQTLRSSLS